MLPMNFLQGCVESCEFFPTNDRLRALVADAYRCIQSTPMQRKLLYTGARDKACFSLGVIVV